MSDSKCNLMAQVSAFSSAVKCLNDTLEKKLALLDNTKEKKGDKDMDSAKEHMNKLFDISYRNNHSQRVRLGKLKAKRERIACYYANGEISEDNYKSSIAHLNRLESEIKCLPSQFTTNKRGILFCSLLSDISQKQIPLKEQEERLTNYCRNNNISIITTYKLANEPILFQSIFKSMIDFIREQEDKVVLVCEKANSLTHTFEEYRRISNLIKSGKLELHLLQENVVLSQESNCNILLNLGVIVNSALQLAS